MGLRPWSLLLVACFSPHYDDGRIECGPGGTCPHDLVCAADNRCRMGPAPGNDAGGTGDGGGPDAGPFSQLTLIIEAPSGSGAVLSTPAGIDCGATCSHTFDTGTPVQLTATPGAQTALVGWKADGKTCGRETTCDVTLDGPRAVTARFASIGQVAWLHPILAASQRVLVELDDHADLVFAMRMAGSLSVMGTPVETFGLADVLVGKISAGGELLWVRHFGSAEADNLDALGVDHTSGDVVIGGSFTAAEIDLGGPQKLANTSASGSADLYLVRLDGATGAQEWQKVIATDDVDEPSLSSVTIDPNGDVIVGCWAWASINLGDGMVTIAGPSGDMFLAKLDGANGSVVWKNQLGGPTTGAYLVSVRVDSLGNVAAGGYFSGTDLELGSLTKPDASGPSDGFVAKYTGASGSFLWQQTFGGTGNDRLEDLGIGAADAVLVAASIEKVPAEDLVFLGAILPGSGLGREIVAARLNSALGAPVWARRYGGPGDDTPSGIVGYAGGAVLTGNYSGSLTFDAQPAVSSMGSDGYLVTLADADGAATYAVTLGGAGADVSTDVAALGANIVVAGRFAGSATFLGQPLTATHAADNFILSFFRP